jgi:transcriptional regulator with XRE-family HTH domain
MAVTLGQRLKTLRTDRAMRLLDLSKASGITISQLSDLEQDRNLPSLRTLHRLAVAHGIPVGELLADVDPWGFV